MKPNNNINYYSGPNFQSVLSNKINTGYFEEVEMIKYF